MNRMCIIRILHICSALEIKRTGENAFSGKQLHIRVFLSSYLIISHPKKVFEYFNTLVHALMEIAKSMLMQYEQICEILCKKEKDPQKLLESTDGFLAKLFLFMDKFREWKKPDEKVLYSRIKVALSGLIYAKKHAPHSDPNYAKTIQEINYQIKRLRNKISTIAGKDALEEYDRETDFGSVIQEGESSSYVGNPSGVVQENKRMTNEQLAHELLLDPAYVLTPLKAAGCHNPVDAKIKECFLIAFWKSITADMKNDPPVFSRVLKVLKEIRDGTVELCNKKHLQERTFEVLDIAFIDSQLQKNSFSWESCIMLVHATFKIFMQVEESKYNEKTIEQATQLVARMKSNPNDPEVFTEALDEMLKKVNDIRVQLANQRLRLIAPVVAAHGIDYERGKMREKLESGQLTMENLKRMIGQVTGEIIIGNDLEVARMMSAGTSRALFHTCYAKFMVHVLNTQPLDETNMPETLLLDTERCKSFQRFLFGFTSTATTSALIKTFSRESKV